MNFVIPQVEVRCLVTQVFPTSLCEHVSPHSIKPFVCHDQVCSFVGNITALTLKYLSSSTLFPLKSVFVDVMLISCSHTPSCWTAVTHHNTFQFVGTVKGMCINGHCQLQFKFSSWQSTSSELVQY